MKDSGFTFRLEERDKEYFNWLTKEIAESTGLTVTRTWVVTEMVRLGMPIFEKKYSIKKPKEYKGAGENLRRDGRTVEMKEKKKRA